MSTQGKSLNFHTASGLYKMFKEVHPDSLMSADAKAALLTWAKTIDRTDAGLNKVYDVLDEAGSKPWKDRRKTVMLKDLPAYVALKLKSTSPKRTRKSPKKTSSKRKSTKRKSSSKSPKRKSPKRKSPKRKSHAGTRKTPSKTRTRSPKRKSPKRTGSKSRTRRVSPSKSPKRKTASKTRTRSPKRKSTKRKLPKRKSSTRKNQ